MLSKLIGKLGPPAFAAVLMLAGLGVLLADLAFVALAPLALSDVPAKAYSTAEYVCCAGMGLVYFGYIAHRMLQPDEPHDSNRN